jgi:hypothetical protein
MRASATTVTLSDMNRIPSRHRFVVAAIAVSSIGLLSGVVGGPLATSGAAAPKKTTPPKKTVPKKTVPKKVPAAPATAKVPNGKAVADSAAGRDKFCDALLVFRANVRANLDLPANEGQPVDVQVSNTAAANVGVAFTLGASAHLPILKWAANDAAATYESIIGSVKPTDNPQQQLAGEIKALSEDGIDGQFLLNAYALTRCNMSMFVYDFGNVDAAPSTPEGIQLADEIDKEGRAAAVKFFPKAPPAGKKWPRASLFSGDASPAPTTTPPTTEAP